MRDPFMLSVQKSPIHRDRKTENRGRRGWGKQEVTVVDPRLLSRVMEVSQCRLRVTYTDHHHRMATSSG